MEDKLRLKDVELSLLALRFEFDFCLLFWSSRFYSFAYDFFIVFSVASQFITGVLFDLPWSIGVNIGTLRLVALD